MYYSLGFVSEFSDGKLLIFSDRASKILTNFEAEAFKIPIKLALASFNVGKFRQNSNQFHQHQCDPQAPA